MKFFAAISGLLLLVTPVVLSCENGDAALRAAIGDAVKARVGSDAEVIVGRMQIFTRANERCHDASSCQATPDPAARLGRTIRFTLSGVRRDGPAVRFERIGVVEADVTVTATVARATSVIRRGDVVTNVNAERTAQTLADVPLGRLPDLAEVLGAKALRDIAPGERLSAGMLLVPPTVRTGQHVTAVSRMGEVEATATLTAAESGVSGDIIRLVNPDSRRALRARILSPSRVEIVQ